MAGSYGRKDPSGMTRLFVNGTNPPAPSGTVPSESPQKKKKQNGVGMASMAGIVTGTSRRGWAKTGVAATGGKWLSIYSKRRTRRVRIAADNELPDFKEGQRTIPSLQSLSRLTSSWNVCFLECLQGVILRNGIRHIEAARLHTDLALKREKQADRWREGSRRSCGRRADDDETALGIGIEIERIGSCLVLALLIS
jgi:hypothetical protein